MAGFTVTCAGCGRVFSLKSERFYLDRDSRSYVCSQCIDRAGINVPRYKPRGKTGTILRIVFGILFVLSAFNATGDGDGVWVTCLLIGLGLLFWQFWPQLWGILLKKRNHAAVLQLREEYAAREAERRAQEAARPKLCPHCGATTTGLVCEYCGMPLEG